MMHRYVCNCQKDNITLAMYVLVCVTVHDTCMLAQFEGICLSLKSFPEVPRPKSTQTGGLNHARLPA